MTQSLGQRNEPPLVAVVADDTDYECAEQIASLEVAHAAEVAVLKSQLELVRDDRLRDAQKLLAGLDEIRSENQRLREEHEAARRDLEETLAKRTQEFHDEVARLNDSLAKTRDAHLDVSTPDREHLLSLLKNDKLAARIHG